MQASSDLKSRDAREMLWEFRRRVVLLGFWLAAEVVLWKAGLGSQRRMRAVFKETKVIA